MFELSTGVDALDLQSLAEVAALHRHRRRSYSKNVCLVTGNYSLNEQLRIPLALRRERVTLFHAPHYVLPPLVRTRSVVTITNRTPPAATAASIAARRSPAFSIRSAGMSCTAASEARSTP